jgi:hypothetical protein
VLTRTGYLSRRKALTFVQTGGCCYWWEIVPSGNVSFVKRILVGWVSGVWTQKSSLFGWWPLRLGGGGGITSAEGLHDRGRRRVNQSLFSRCNAYLWVQGEHFQHLSEPACLSQSFLCFLVPRSQSHIILARNGPVRGRQPELTGTRQCARRSENKKTLYFQLCSKCDVVFIDSSCTLLCRIYGIHLRVFLNNVP